MVDDPDLHSEVDMLDIASGASFIRKEPAITRRLTFEHDTDICSLTENVKRLLESSSKQEALRIVIVSIQTSWRECVVLDEVL